MSEEESRPQFTVKDAEAEEPPGGLPRLDFSTFVLSLGTSGMMHLGLVPLEEGDEKPEPNLPLAQQVIDTLDMLQDKTRGNLGDEEQKLLESVLYELRMNFVKTRKAGDASRPPRSEPKASGGGPPQGKAGDASRPPRSEPKASKGGPPQGRG